MEKKMEKKLNGRTLRAFLEANLLKLPDDTLFRFALSNRDVLLADPDLFAIEAHTNDINAIEREHAAKFIIGETNAQGRFFALLKKWEDISLEVSVWNCRATIFYRNDAGASVDYKVLDQKLDEQLEQLANDSVYDAGGAINMSGIYPPNADLIRTFREGIAEGKIEGK